MGLVDDVAEANSVNDLLTVLGSALFHPTNNRLLTTEERLEWIQGLNRAPCRAATRVTSTQTFIGLVQTERGISLSTRMA